jgi:hypothetical protein
VPLIVQHMDVEALPAEIESSMQHMGRGLLYDLGALTPHSFVYRRPFFIPFVYQRFPSGPFVTR